MAERLHAEDSSFFYLNATQFMGALNDNIFKLLIIFSIINIAGAESAGKVTAVVGMVFVLPFLLFTPVAGVITDRISKRAIIIAVKCWEIIIMATGIIAFYLHLPMMEYIVLFMMSMQSAFFGPSKYGIIPELVEEKDLSRANSYIVTFTFLAIILGSFLGPFLSDMLDGTHYKAAFFCLLVAVAGAICSFMIRKHPLPQPDKLTPLYRFDSIFTILYTYRHQRTLMFSVVASMYFYFIGAFMQLNLIPYGMEILGLTQEKSGYLFLVAAVGIGIGSVIAGKFSKGRIEFGLIPVGAMGLAGSIIGLSVVVYPWGILSLVLSAGISSGIFIVPIQAYIQYKSPAVHRGKIIAASGFMGWIGILAASLCLYFLRETAGVSSAKSFMPLGILTITLGIFMIRLFPQFIRDTKNMLTQMFTHQT
ncbi:MAG: MFS transporter [Candidatus Auribacterota bacterium]|jgi:acyl-[acyl-carrier-protein]-phospholipid O-acyltransferase/long-chain-fatty-acid--[acyl-carrier-protein] ligase|nr:MFS transporter [Candidatus Auribacterota bacterium]